MTEAVETAPRGALMHYTGILADRYLSITLADTGATFILLLQAPLIGFFIALAWQDGVQNHGILNFILSLVAVWFGCINACREVVKERAIFLREKRIGVPVRAYLLSKLLVLALIAFLQCLTLTLIVFYNLPGYKIGRAALMLHLFGAALSATCLGLLVSCCVKSQNTAVGLIPIVLIPQVIFSEVVLGDHRREELEYFMPVAWTYNGLEELWSSSWEAAPVLGALIMLTVLGLLFLGGAAFVLSLAAEE